jgi:hypothetical protein
MIISRYDVTFKNHNAFYSVYFGVNRVGSVAKTEDGWTSTPAFESTMLGKCSTRKGAAERLCRYKFLGKDDFHALR